MFCDFYEELTVVSTVFVETLVTQSRALCFKRLEQLLSRVYFLIDLWIFRPYRKCAFMPNLEVHILLAS